MKTRIAAYAIKPPVLRRDVRERDVNRIWMVPDWGITRMLSEKRSVRGRLYSPGVMVSGREMGARRVPFDPDERLRNAFFSRTSTSL